MYKSWFLLLFVLFLNSREIALNELNTIIEGEEITIKGYLLKRKEGFVLSGVPAIKSCCPITGPSLKVEGEFCFSPYQVVKLKGVIQKGALFNATLVP